MTTPLLLGLDVVAESASITPRAYVGDLYRFPDAVAEGMHRELERLDQAGIPAYAEGRRVWTPHASFDILLDGRPSRGMRSTLDFPMKSRDAAYRMESGTSYSFNQAFYTLYVKGISHA